ncbi:hypothetical protein HOLleu_39776 [Holothuria leucospilota]|uniref:EF-hand domain-containing protein n=1 Tax=Holothuria leucospilota TaxID=206669 RepID=A0A9Q1BCK1_HOLLE|nr:hypothetical protein HOLleu_39776 [Holothuria leucospilota]
MPRFIFSVLTVLAIVAMLDGCSVTGDNKSKGRSGSVRTTRWKREVDGPIIATESELGLPRPRNRHSRTPSNPKDSELLAEEIFRRIDTSGNGMVDAGEWVDFSRETSIWDLAKLLDFADVNDSESVSLEEFLSVLYGKNQPIRIRKERR